MKRFTFIAILLATTLFGCENRKERAVELNDRAVELASHTNDLSELEQAINLLDSASRLDPTNPKPLVNRGKFYAFLNDSLSIHYYRQARQIDPLCGVTAHIGMAYDRSGRADSARYYYEKAFEENREAYRQKDDEKALYNWKYAGTILTYLLTDDADSARRFLYEGIDTTEAFYLDNRHLFDSFGDFSLIESSFFPLGRSGYPGERDIPEIRPEVPLLVYLLANLSASTRKKFYENLDTTGAFYRDNRNLIEKYDRFTRPDSSLILKEGL